MRYCQTIGDGATLTFPFSATNGKAPAWSARSPVTQGRKQRSRGGTLLWLVPPMDRLSLGSELSGLLAAAKHIEAIGVVLADRR